MQTIIWGRSLQDQFPNILKTIRSIGFHGIEVFQHPASLPRPKELEQLLGDDLRLLGLAGGDLDDRVNYAKALQKSHPFIYSQSVQEKELNAIAEGFTIGLHPHQYSSISTFTAAKRLILDNPGKSIEIIYDTAHSFLAGESILDTIQKHGEEIRYIHLKDWNPRFGSSFFSYAKGFCAAGDGIVLDGAAIRDELIKWLSGSEERWLIIEQDWADESIDRCLRKSMDWIMGKHSNLTARTASKTQYSRSQIVNSGALVSGSQRMLLDFKAQMLSSVQKPSLSVYRAALDQLSQYVNCIYASLWEVNSACEVAIIRATYRPIGGLIVEPQIQQLDMRKSLSWRAIETGYPVVCSNVQTVSDGGRVFQDREIAITLNLKGMIVLPVFNSYNENQPELIVCLFPSDLSAALTMLGLPQVTSQLESSTVKSHLVECVTSALSVVSESSWHHTTTSIANSIGWHAAQSRNSEDFLKRAADVAISAVSCRSVEIYWLSADDTLTCVYPKTNKPVHILKNNQTWHWNVINRDRSQMIGTDAQWTLKSREILASPLYAQSIPISSVVGMIACFSKSTPEGELPKALFSMTDIAALDAIQSAITLHLVKMMEDEASVRQMRRIVHELREPLTIFRGASSEAISEMKKQGWVFPGKDHLQVFRRYLGTMEQTAAMIGFTRDDFQLILQRTRCLLFEQIIEPALEDLEVLLNNNMLSRKQIDISRALGGGALYLDVFRMRQVVFNLLVNAVKYSKRKSNGEVDPEKFRIEIEGQSSGAKSILIVRDYGIGIPQGYEEVVFDEAVRAPNARRAGVIGDGLGLHIVKEILSAHEATIRVSREAEYAGTGQPVTVIVIEFPAKLKEPAYKNHLPADFTLQSNTTII